MATSIAGALQRMGSTALGASGPRIVEPVKPPGGIPAPPLAPVAPIAPASPAVGQAQPKMAAPQMAPAVPASAPIQPTSAPAGIAPLAQPRNDSVVSHFNKITESGSPLIKMAEQAGLNTANKRGLLNSSMAAGAARGEAYRVALPIAQQEAQTGANANLAAEDRAAQMERLRTQGTQSIEQIRTSGEVQGGLADKDAAAQMTRLQTNLASEMARLDRQIASSEGQQRTQLIAEKERLEISGRQEMERLTKAADLDRQRITLQGQIESALSTQGSQQQQELQKLQGTIQTALQTQADSATMARLKETFDQNLKLQVGENAAALDRIRATGDQNLRALLQQQEGALAELSMTLASQDRNKIAELAVAVFEKEAGMRAALLSNTEMPAAERAAYERAISSMGDPVRAYLGALYTPPGGSGGLPPPPAGIAPQPTPSPIVIAPTQPTGIAPTTAPATGFGASITNFAEEAAARAAEEIRRREGIAPLGGFA